MKIGIASAVVALCVLVVATSSAPAGELDLNERVVALVRKHYPKAVVDTDGGKLVAKHGTMVFTIHRHWKTGEIRKETDQVEGPNFQGFVLSLSVQEGKYEGQAMVPQTLREPYWRTFIDRPPTDDGKGHYVFNFSYGSRLDEKFKKALLELLPKSRPPSRR